MLKKILLYLDWRILQVTLNHNQENADEIFHSILTDVSCRKLLVIIQKVLNQILFSILADASCG